jgi:hypothetical protein
MLYVWSAILSLYFGVTRTAFAQSAVLARDSAVSFPPIRQHWTPEDPVVPYTAAEWEHGARIYGQQAAADQSPDVLIYPKDSIAKATAAVVRQWLATLKADGIGALQLDSYGVLHVISDQDAKAKQIFDERLSKPGVPLSDAAFTLNTAVRAFADADKPARLPVAEQYMARLDALPKGPSDLGASAWQFRAHYALLRAYFLIGNTAAAVAHARRAMALVPDLFFPSRMAFYGGGLVYFTLANHLIATHDTAGLRAMERQLLSWTIPPDSLVAEDSAFARMGHKYAGGLRAMMVLAAMLGQSAPDVRGTSWINVADTAEHGMRLNDGTVRIVGMGRLAHALTMLPAFERLSEKVKGDFGSIFLIPASGFWGTEFVTPTQESTNIRRYLTNTRPTRIPVAIWAAEKTRTRDDGLLPTPSPTIREFGASGVPFVAIVDGGGKIRHFFTSFDRDEEAQAAAVIETLLRQ